MACIDVVRVTRCPADLTQFWGHHIDAPVEGAALDTTALPIGGWVLPRSGRAVAIEVLHRERVLTRIPVREPRPDLIKVFPQLPEAECYGFWGSVRTIGLRAETELVLRARLEDGRQVTLGTIVAEFNRLNDAYEAKIQPLLVTSLGRTGTTWLMRILSHHPRIVIRSEFPYETRCAIYWMHMLQVLSQPADHQESAHPDNFYYDLRHVGHHPMFTPSGLPVELRRWFGQTYVERLSAFCRESIDSFYTEVSLLQGIQRPAYFGEKLNPGVLPTMFWDLYPGTREIFLVRDLRDVICSILAFNRKRGYAAFGREYCFDDVEYVQQMGGSAHAMLDDCRDRLGASHFLRYEDLIATPECSLTKVLEYLGLQSTPETVGSVLQLAARETPEMQAHITASDPQHSIGRWRTELSAEMQAACQDAFGDVLSEWGYA